MSTDAFGTFVKVTRPSDTNAYTAGDALGSLTSSGGAVLTFVGAGQGQSGELIITSAALEYDLGSVPSGMTSFVLYLYSVTPPSAFGDNAAWSLPSGDRASYLGSIALGTPVALASSTLYIEATGINKQISMPGNVAGTLFGYLVTTAGFTPSSADVFKITLHALAL